MRRQLVSHERHVLQWLALQPSSTSNTVQPSLQLALVSSDSLLHNFQIHVMPAWLMDCSKLTKSFVVATNLASDSISVAIISIGNNPVAATPNGNSDDPTRFVAEGLSLAVQRLFGEFEEDGLVPMHTNLGIIMTGMPIESAIPIPSGENYDTALAQIILKTNLSILGLLHSTDKIDCAPLDPLTRKNIHSQLGVPPTCCAAENLIPILTRMIHHGLHFFDALQLPSDHSFMSPDLTIIYEVTLAAMEYFYFEFGPFSNITKFESTNTANSTPLSTTSTPKPWTQASMYTVVLTKLNAARSRLTALGYPPPKGVHLSDPNSLRKQVKHFQRTVGLEVTMVLDKRTRTKMDSNTTGRKTAGDVVSEIGGAMMNSLRSKINDFTGLHAWGVDNDSDDRSGQMDTRSDDGEVHKNHSLSFDPPSLAATPSNPTLGTPTSIPSTSQPIGPLAANTLTVDNLAAVAATETNRVLVDYIKLVMEDKSVSSMNEIKIGADGNDGGFSRNNQVVDGSQSPNPSKDTSNTHLNIGSSWKMGRRWSTTNGLPLFPMLSQNNSVKLSQTANSLAAGPVGGSDKSAGPTHQHSPSSIPPVLGQTDAKSIDQDFSQGSIHANILSPRFSREASLASASSIHPSQKQLVDSSWLTTSISSSQNINDTTAPISNDSSPYTSAPPTVSDVAHATSLATRNAYESTARSVGNSNLPKPSLQPGSPQKNGDRSIGATSKFNSFDLTLNEANVGAANTDGSGLNNAGFLESESAQRGRNKPRWMMELMAEKDTSASQYNTQRFFSRSISVPLSTSTGACPRPSIQSMHRYGVYTNHGFSSATFITHALRDTNKDTQLVNGMHRRASFSGFSKPIDFVNVLPSHWYQQRNHHVSSMPAEMNHLINELNTHCGTVAQALTSLDTLSSTISELDEYIQSLEDTIAQRTQLIDRSLLIMEQSAADQDKWEAIVCDTENDGQRIEYALGGASEVVVEFEGEMRRFLKGVNAAERRVGEILIDMAG
ncbi:hypothetical protein QVD99_004622 [Batrachochytrium dendrobatidis]|nr:hypothetical protein QVD99_004622 [Batrachochytrium dendrobatidis]